MLTAQRLRELLRYDPDTGEFWWRKSAGGRSVRWPAGCEDGLGYIRLTIDYKQYLGHRLAWLYMTGEWPREEIDHRDLNPSNNCWDNLREATRSQNRGNSRRSRVNSSGLKGVRFEKGAWRARVKFQGRSYCGGRHATPEAAKAAHDVLAQRLFGDFARSA